MRRVLLLALVAGTLLPAMLLAEPAAKQAPPEAASGFGTVHSARGAQFMAVTANPHATDTAYAILAQGGSAIDAAIAAQMVLGLVEPQSSGIGGGGFLLHWAAEAGDLRYYDGRETAPLALTPEHFLTAAGEPMGFFDAVVGGHAVGTPGLVRMLALAHERHGQLPWAALFQPAIALAETGFAVSPRLHRLLSVVPRMRAHPSLQDYFFPGGEPVAVGTVLRNPAYARSLRQLAEAGPAIFYQGELGAAVVRAVQQDPVRPGQLAARDLAQYQAKERPAVCAGYRQWRVCGAGPPSSGGSTVLAMLGMLEALDWDREPAPLRAHGFAEAGDLAFADRNTYLADPDFVSVPLAQLLAPDYLARRAGLIQRDRALGTATPGLNLAWLPAAAPELPSTSHLSIVDAQGNGVSLTTSIETAFGSRLLVNGFLLNNQLTDFSFVPTAVDGARIANRVEGGKRPRSSMAPMMVFDEQGQLRLLVGSPGGSRIIAYVARVLYDHLGRGEPLAAAIAAPHWVARNDGVVELEQDRGSAAVAAGLSERGHRVRWRPQTSGLHGIVRQADGQWLGVADPRREGTARGR